MIESKCAQCGARVDARSKTGLCRSCWQKPVDQIRLTTEEAAYIAGLSDGEAHISIQRNVAMRRRRTPTYKLAFAIAMTDREPIDYIVGLLPFAMNVECRAKGRRLPCYRLRLMTRTARRVLEIILPYLKAKRKEAEICLAFENMRDRYALKKFVVAPEGYIREAEELYWQLRSLHKNKKPRSKRAVERLL